MNCFVSETVAGAVIYAGNDGGIWKSIDAGEHWQFLPNSPAPVSHLAINPVDTSTLYSGTDVSIYQSADGGQTWSLIFSGLTGPGDSRHLTGLAVNPQTPQILWASFDASVSSGGPLYNSTDGGATWTPITPTVVGQPSSPYSLSSLLDLVIDPFMSSTIYITAGDFWSGVYRSDDNGVTWQFKNSSLITSIYADPSTQNVLYGFKDNYPPLFYTSNGGNNWVQSNNSYFPTNIVTHSGLGGAIFMGTQSGIYQSDSPSGPWTPVNNGLGINGSLQGVPYVRTMNLHCPFGVFAGLDTGVCRTDDLGTSWQPKNQGLNNAVVTSLAIAKDAQHTIYVGTENNGIFKSTDHGQSWQPGNNGLISTCNRLNEVLALAVDPKNPQRIYAAVDNQRLYRSTDGGANWTATQICLPTSVMIDPENPDTIYAFADWDPAYPYRSFWRSSDAGQTWTTDGINNGIRVYPTTNFYTLMPPVPISFPIYASGHTNDGRSIGLIKLTDSSASWTYGGIGNDCRSLAIDPKDRDTIYLGGQDGLFKTTNGGAVWSPVRVDLFSGRTVASIAIDPLTSEVYIALQNGGPAQSNDGGQTWHLPSGGVWKSSDRGQTWTDLGLLPNRGVNAVALDPDTATIYCGLEGAGVATSNLVRQWLNPGVLTYLLLEN